MVIQGKQWNAKYLCEGVGKRLEIIFLVLRSMAKLFSHTMFMVALLLVVGCHRQQAAELSFQNPPVDAANCRSQVSLVGGQHGYYTLKTGKGDTVALNVRVTNLGQQVWVDRGERPFRLGIMWFRKGASDHTPQASIREQRISLPDIILTGDTVDLSGRLGPVADPGEYEVWVGPVQDGVAWCWHFGDEPLKVWVHVE